MKLCGWPLIATVVLSFGNGIEARGQAALDLSLGAVQTGQRSDPRDLYSLADGVSDSGEVPLRQLTGVRQLTAWARSIESEDDLIQTFETLTDRVEIAGGDITFKCADTACGGFDFRRSLELLPPPSMYIDLADFYALGATLPGQNSAIVLVISRTASELFWQLTEISETPASAVVAPAAELPADSAEIPRDEISPQTPLSLSEELDQMGFAVLEDVEFASGKSGLGDPLPPSLTTLSGYLAAHPNIGVTIVGHSDGQGNADFNRSLSQRRAASIRDALVERFGIARARVASDGVGALAPRDTNATASGRARNRRVVAVLTTP